MRVINAYEIEGVAGGDRWCEEKQPDPTISPEDAELLANCVQGMTQFGPNWDCLMYIISR